MGLDANQMTINQLISLLAPLDLKSRAAIAKAQTIQNEAPYGRVIDLSIERTIFGIGENAPIEINVPFKFLRFFDGDSTCRVKVITTDLQDEKQQYDILKNNGTVKADEGVEFAKAYILNDAQPGKSMNFRAYRFQVVESGSLISEATSRTIIPSSGTITNPAFTSGAPAQSVLAQNDGRFKATFYNNKSVSIFLGFAATVTDSGATRGIELAPGAFLSLANSAEIFAYCSAAVSAGELTIVEE